MELIYAIAEYLDIPNEFISIDNMVGSACWFSVKDGGKYTCSTVRNQKFLKKNSIRKEF